MVSKTRQLALGRSETVTKVSTVYYLFVESPGPIADFDYQSIQLVSSSG